jgi:hypothetical protein
VFLLLLLLLLLLFLVPLPGIAGHACRVSQLLMDRIRNWEVEGSAGAGPRLMFPYDLPLCPHYPPAATTPPCILCWDNKAPLCAVEACTDNGTTEVSIRPPALSTLPSSCNDPTLHSVLGYQGPTLRC